MKRNVPGCHEAVHAQQPRARGVFSRRTVSSCCRSSSSWSGGEKAIDEVIDVMGRATVEAVLRMSAEQRAGPKRQGRRADDRALYWHGSQPGRVTLSERQLRVEKAASAQEDGAAGGSAARSRSRRTTRCSAISALPTACWRSC